MKNLFFTLVFALLSMASLATQDSTLVVHQPETVDLAIGPGWPYYYDGNEGVITYWTTGDVLHREEFSAPLYMTFTVEKQLKKEENGRWNIGFGFGILNVKSELDFENELESVNQKIRRTYGVIPLYAKYNMVQKEKFRAFVSGGINAEFGINGRIETTSSYQGSQESFNSAPFPLGLGQLNFNSGVGVSYALMNKLSINAELNASTYLSDKLGSVIWDEKSVWMNLKTGLALRI